MIKLISRKKLFKLGGSISKFQNGGKPKQQIIVIPSPGYKAIGTRGEIGRAKNGMPQQDIDLVYATAKTF